MQKKYPLAGGVFVALGAIIGVSVGHYQGQTSAGLLIGVAVGAVIAIAVWRMSR
jgi:uncharacterized membrane protein (UPF0136 family)